MKGVLCTVRSMYTLLDKTLTSDLPKKEDLLVFSCDYGNLALLKLLFPSCGKNLANNILQWCVRSNQCELVEWLSNRVDIHAENDYAVKLAIMFSNTRVLEIFESKTSIDYNYTHAQYCDSPTMEICTFLIPRLKNNINLEKLLYNSILNKSDINVVKELTKKLQSNSEISRWLITSVNNNNIPAAIYLWSLTHKTPFNIENYSQFYRDWVAI